MQQFSIESKNSLDKINNNQKILAINLNNIMKNNTNLNSRINLMNIKLQIVNSYNFTIN